MGLSDPPPSEVVREKETPWDEIITTDWAWLEVS
jgi:hypothetical protein